MSLDTLIPRDLTTLLYVAIASILGWIGGWIRGRKKEGAEVLHLSAQADKTSAEARQINVNTDITLIQAAAMALARAERLQAERDHWERKACDMVIDFEELREKHAQLNTRYRLKKYSLEKAMGLLGAHHISFSEGDDPRENDDDHGS